MSPMQFLAVLAALSLAGCGRPVSVRDVPAGRILIEDTAGTGTIPPGDTVSVTFSENNRWLTETYFADGTQSVEVYDGTHTTTNSAKIPVIKGEAALANSLDFLRRFASPELRARGFAYQGTVTRNGAAYDLYAGLESNGLQAVRGMRVYVNRASGLVECREQKIDALTERKTFSYQVWKAVALPDGIQPGESSVWAFGCLDVGTIAAHENLGRFASENLRPSPPGR